MPDSNRSSLEQIVTGYKKWVLNANLKRRLLCVQKDETPQPLSKTELHPKKVKLDIWWNFRDEIHFELLPTNQATPSEFYSHQLDKLNQALIQKEPTLVN